MSRNAVDFGIGLQELVRKFSVGTYAVLAFVEETEEDISSAYFGNVEDNDVHKLQLLMRRMLGSMIGMSIKYLGLSPHAAVGMLRALLDEAAEDVVSEHRAHGAAVGRAKKAGIPSRTGSGEA